MMKERTNRLLAELESRYGMDSTFSMRFRPVAEKILDPGTPESARPELLTLLAETYERQVQVRQDCNEAAERFRLFFQDLSELLKRAYGLDSSPRKEE